MRTEMERKSQRKWNENWKESELEETMPKKKRNIPET
jgi:hypothetical protein